MASSSTIGHGTQASSSTSNTPSRVVPPGPGGASSLTVNDILCDSFTRRIALLVYLKGVLAGKHLYASTVLFSPRDLADVYDTERMRRRSYRHLVLGLALSPLVEQISMPLPDFVRSLGSALADVEALPETAGSSSAGLSAAGYPSSSAGGGSVSSEKRSVRSLFSSSKNKGQKKGGTFSDIHPPDFGMSTMGGVSGASSEIAGGHLPFALDFFQTFTTLADILIEIYSKLLTYLGAAGPSAGLSPTDDGIEGMTATTSSLPPLASQVVDAINKADGKVKKMLAQVTKELDGAARHVVKEELAQLEAGLSPNAPQNSAIDPHSRVGSTRDDFGDGSMGSTSPYTGLPGPPSSMTHGDFASSHG